MHDVNTASAPIKMHSLFMKTSDVHSYNTRSSTSSNVYIKASNLELQKIALSRIGARLWNEIPRNLRELPKKSFKARTLIFQRKKIKIIVVVVAVVVSIRFKIFFLQPMLTTQKDYVGKTNMGMPRS